MLLEASSNPAQIDRGVSVVIVGRVFDLDNVSISNAIVSIQVNNPQGSSTHVAIAYTNPAGHFEDSFLLPPSSPGGNYTAFLVADKPGFDVVKLVLIFAYSTPDFSIEPSVSSLLVRQGESASLTMTILSIRGFNQAVNVTVLDPPMGVTIQFEPPFRVPSGTVTAKVSAASVARVGNYSVVLLGVSGSLSHKISIRLVVARGPAQLNFPTLLLAAGFIGSLALATMWLFLRERRSKGGRNEIEGLLRRVSADSSYVATARVIARLEELRAMGKVDDGTYERLKKEYERRLEKFK